MVAGLTSLCLLALLGLLVIGLQGDPRASVSPLLDHPAPAVTLKTLDGTWFSLTRLRGRPIVLNFWASWCVGCRLEHPYLLLAWHTYRPDGVAFAGIVFSDSVGNARSFLREHGGGWPNLQDPNGSAAVRYGVSAVPETFFIDRRGIVRYKSVGPVTPHLLTLEINRLLRT
ncbi:MAG: hypothetical protein DLM70_12725 [Chloroflexi bacterium]|nr:MAG: hypothetical protein DLM70_12725 [Chloroflexota bacterium]